MLDMSKLKELCSNVEANITDTIAKNPLAGAMMIGKLYLYQDQVQPEDKGIVQAAFASLKAKLTAAHVQSLFEALTKFTLRDMRKMNPDGPVIIQRLKHEMVCDFDIFKYLNILDLARLGQHPDFYKEVLVALIRNHLSSQGAADPFAQPTFSYKILKETGSEQNILASYIQSCASLPVDALVTLGIDDPKIAEFILLDILSSNKGYLATSCRFAHHYPTLAGGIAKEWAKRLNGPQEEAALAFIKAELPGLKAKFPEFRELDIESRIKKNHTVQQETPAPAAPRPSLDLSPFGKKALGTCRILSPLSMQVTFILAHKLMPDKCPDPAILDDCIPQTLAPPPQFKSHPLRFFLESLMPSKVFLTNYALRRLKPEVFASERANAAPIPSI